jgi:hypothetical protein
MSNEGLHMTNNMKTQKSIHTKGRGQQSSSNLFDWPDHSPEGAQGWGDPLDTLSGIRATARIPGAASGCVGVYHNVIRTFVLKSGRFFSHHDDAIVYFDSRHRLTKTKLGGGLMGKLVEELQPEDIVTLSDWPKRSYRYQLEALNGGDGVSVIELTHVL